MTDDTSLPPSPAELVSRYADRMWSQWDGDLRVTSPLGVWLLLAQLAPAATGAERDELADALGCDPGQAAAVSARLLADVHPEVAAAVVVWAREELLGGRWHEWSAGLDPVLERGAMPTQDAADTWARERTLGLIDRFPGSVGPPTALVLASALATKLRWRERFDVDSGQYLGGPLGDGLARSLVTGPTAGQQPLVVETAAVGDVAVLVTDAVGGVRVLSVVALDAAAPSSDVHRAALEVAALDDAALDDAARDWWALPVGAADVLEVTEREVMSPSGDELAVWAVLPAWDAAVSQDVAGAPGVGAALATGASMVIDPGPMSAVQVARARFGQDGFEAAALTALMVGAAFAPSPPAGNAARRREVTLRFCRPYAVVAQVAHAGGRCFGDGFVAQAAAAGPWAGVPVFSAWVTDSVEPD